MAYESTDVPVSRSQEAIRGLIYSHQGTGVVFISQPPQEGFEAMMTIAGKSFHVRIVATCKKAPERQRNGYLTTDKLRADFRAREERRVWRVLFYHLKAQMEAADSGVVSLERLMMPYVVLRDGRTLADHIMPRIEELTAGDPARMLIGEIGQ